ncbi:unnamed protein product, partial [marine sediment metagenome]
LAILLFLPVLFGLDDLLVIRLLPTRKTVAQVEARGAIVELND